MTKDYEDFKIVTMDKKCPKKARFDAVRTTTSEKTDLTQKMHAYNMQYCRTGTHLVRQELRCGVIQQQNGSG